MNEPLIWVLGAGGLLGSHLRSALSRHLPRARFWQPVPAHVSWTDPARLADDLSRLVANFAAALNVHGNAWTLLWCAGKGTVSSPTSAMEPEWCAWTLLLDLLGRHLVGAGGGRSGNIFLASSAGGIYGANPPDLITEHTPAHPASEYGAHKLRMETALRNWAAPFSNIACLIGRISTLYGPGQDLRKPQGIISHLSRCLIHRRQVSIYVPLDTRRDYYFVDDCADQIATCIVHLMNERPQVILKVLASERLTSLAEVVGIFSRMARRRPFIVSRNTRDAQPISLKFRSEIWRELGTVRRTDLVAGIHLLHAHHLALFQRGLLPPPT